jgi:hypothetical protein
MSTKKIILIEVVIGLLAFAGSLYVALTPANSLMNWYNIDDAFYYYKVAQHVWAGNGFTFDGINPANGFHPLWMVVCLGIFWLSKFSLIFPLRVLVIVSGLFNAATAIVLYRLLARYLHPLASITGALFWGLNYSIYNVTTVHGMESAISAFFIVLLLQQASKFLADYLEKPIPFLRMAGLGLIGALTILSRLDNVFVVAAIGFFVLFRIRRISIDLIYDWIALGLAVIFSWVMRLGISNVEANFYSIYPMIGIAFVINPIVYYFFGMYNGFRQKGIWSRLLRQVLAAVVNTAMMFALSYVLNRLGILKVYSKSVIVIFGAIAFIFILCVRLFEFRKPAEMNVEEGVKTAFAWIKKIWKGVLLEGIGYAIPIGIILGTYCVLNKIYFGTFTPVSGQIKTWWSTLPNTVYSHPNSLITILGLSPVGNYGPWSLLTSWFDRISNLLIKLAGNNSSLYPLIFIFLVVIFVFFIMAIFKSEEKRPARQFFSLLAPALLIGCLVQIAYYNTIGYAHTRIWYWVGEMLAITLLLFVLVDSLFYWLEKISPKLKWVSLVLCCLFILNLAYGHFYTLKALAPMKIAKDQEGAYLSEVHEVENFTQKGSYIGMTGGGLTAYFIHDRTVVNMDGLINSNAYFEAMKKGTATAFLDAIPLSYVYGKSYVVEESDPYKEILHNRLSEIGYIRGYEGFTLYQYEINK